MCDCIELTNKALAEHNAMLETPLRLDFKTGQFLPSRVVVTTFKLDPKKRGKLPAMVATFCPFCGERYP